MKIVRAKTLLMLLVVCVEISCVRFISDKDLMVYRSASVLESENITFAENNIAARVRWKKDIGTLRTHVLDSMKYVLGPDPALLDGGGVYFQDQHNIYSVDFAAGVIQAVYGKPSKYPLSSVVNFDAPCPRATNLIYPLEDMMGKNTAFLLVDNRSKMTSLIASPDPDDMVFCYGERFIAVRNALFGDGLNIYDANLQKRLWWAGELNRNFYAVQASSNALNLLYELGDSIFIDSYELYYDRKDALGVNTGKLLWRSKFLANKDAEKMSYKLTKSKRFGALELRKELLAFVYTNFDDLTGEVGGHVFSIDPRTGENNWEKDIVGVNIKQMNGHDKLFYYASRSNPQMIYGIDQKTGEEKLKIFLKGYNAAQGLISTADKLYYAGVSQSKENPFFYDTFSAVDKTTGQPLWTVHIDQQRSLPHYDAGVLYFGQKPDFYKNVVAGSVKQSARRFERYSKDELPKVLSQTAFAVDAQTGRILWKVRLEGGWESYIEKILVKGNTAFIKSLTGWLYAIEWNKKEN